MKQDRKWLCILCIFAALFLAAGDATDIYAKEASSKTVSISTKELSIAKGQTASLFVKNTEKEAKWKSSDKKVATVSKKGKVKAMKKGTAVITATVGKKKYKCNVTVSDKKAKTLIVYFSATGTTKSAAKKIQKLTGGTLVCLQPEKAYTKNYERLLDVAMQEQETDARPKLSTVIKNRKQYDTVILGYPIWHGQAPRIISTFLESYDFSGKTIVPFCTSHSSGIGSSASNLHALCPDSVKWAEGKRFGAGTSKEAMEEWLAENGLKKPVEGTCSHSYTEAVTKEPSCVETGERTYTCIHCGSSYTEATAAAGHTLAVDPAVPAGCKTQGKTEGSHCSVCGQIIKAQEDIPADGHKTQKEVKKADRSSDGKVKEICTVCSTVVKEQTVASIKFIRLSKESYTYNGKARKPSVTVTDRQGRALSEGTDFTVSYPAGRKNTRIYTLKITFRGSYGGTAEKSFQIIPKRMAIAKLTPKKKGFSVNMIPSFLVLDGFMGEYGRAFPLGVWCFCSVFAGARGSPLCSKMRISQQAERGVFEGCV